jgi:hypothetical protein
MLSQTRRKDRRMAFLTSEMTITIEDYGMITI